MHEPHDKGVIRQWQEKLVIILQEKLIGLTMLSLAEYREEGLIVKKLSKGSEWGEVSDPEPATIPASPGPGRLSDEPPSEFEHAAEETARIRRDPKRQVGWLLKFEKKTIGRHLDPHTGKLCRQVRDLFVPGFRTPQPKELADIQGKLRDGLDTLRRDAPWEFEFSTKAKAVLLPPPRGRAVPSEGGAQLVWRPAKSLQDRFLLNAMKALDAVGDRLRLCRKPGCEALFLAKMRREICPDHAAELQKERLAEITIRRRAERQRLREAKAARRKAR